MSKKHSSVPSRTTIHKNVSDEQPKDQLGCKLDLHVLDKIQSICLHITCRLLNIKQVSPNCEGHWKSSSTFNVKEKMIWSMSTNKGRTLKCTRSQRINCVASEICMYFIKNKFYVHFLIYAGTIGWSWQGTITWIFNSCSISIQQIMIRSLPGSHAMTHSFQPLETIRNELKEIKKILLKGS